jgi:uncharacterized protein
MYYAVLQHHTDGGRVSITEFSGVLFAGSILAGFLGSLTGLGGGVVIVPFLTLLFGVDIRYAIGASLVSVIATSSGAAAAYVREGYSNIRVGMLLEIATTIGATVGAFLATHTSGNVISIIFGAVLLPSVFFTVISRSKPIEQDTPDPLATRLGLNSTCPSESGVRPYYVHSVPMGFLLMWVAGVLSGLLGIGSGAMKVLAMDRAMRLPFKVSTTTSNFMIGVTAAAGSGVFLSKGYIDPGLAMPVMLGVLVGSMIGARILNKARPKSLRILFGIVIMALAVEMIYSGIGGKI